MLYPEPSLKYIMLDLWLKRLPSAGAGGYFLDEFLCGQLGVTRALGNFTSDTIAVKQPADRLKYRTSSDGQPLQFGGPLIAGVAPQ